MILSIITNSTTWKRICQGNNWLLLYEHIIYCYWCICLYPYTSSTGQRFVWRIDYCRRPFYAHCMAIGVTARGLARYNRVSFACLLILANNVHVDVYTFLHSICPMSRIILLQFCHTYYRMMSISFIVSAFHISSFFRTLPSATMLSYLLEALFFHHASMFSNSNRS